MNNVSYNFINSVKLCILLLGKTLNSLACFVHYLCHILSYFLLQRKVNFATSLLLLIGCYLAILIPAYISVNKPAVVSNDYQNPRYLVMTTLNSY